MYSITMCMNTPKAYFCKLFKGWDLYMPATGKLCGIMFFIAFFTMFCSVPMYAGPDPAAVEAAVVEAIETESAAQKKLDAWDEERVRLQEEIRNLNTTIAWLTFRKEKYDAYIDRQQEAIDELKRKRKEMNRLHRELEPFLDECLVRLERLIGGDLPFLPEERRRRLDFLRESLNDYHIHLSEKLRRMIEALQVEAGYGRSIEVTETRLELDSGPVQVRVLRLGRMALFYQTPDCRISGRWNRHTEAWESIDPSYSRTLRQAMDMAQRKRAIELLNLPIGVPEH